MRKAKSWQCGMSDLLLLGIIVYPLVSSFFGIDLGDTGIHLFNYVNVFSNPEQVGFTCYLTNLIGGLWLQFFPFLGLWGLNLLEVFLEWGMVYLVYQLLKPFVNTTLILAGCLVAMACSDTYLNVFNYHQFNVFLLLLILYCELQSLFSGETKWSILAGFSFSMVVASRMGSVTAIATLLIYLLWYCLKGSYKAKQLKEDLLMFLTGALAGAAVIFLILVLTNQLEYFFGNINRLSGLASDESSDYGMVNLVSSFFNGVLTSLTSGAVVLFGFVATLAGMAAAFHKVLTKKRMVLDAVIGILLLVIAIYLLNYADGMNPAPNWPQYSNNVSYLGGVFILVNITALFYWAFVPGRRYRMCLVTLGVASLFLIFLTIAGSNTGVKHYSLAYWLIAPLDLLFIKQMYEALSQTRFLKDRTMVSAKIVCMAAILIPGAFVGMNFLEFINNTNNFDSVYQLSMTHPLQTAKTRFLYTTDRKQEAIDGVLEALEKVDPNQDKKLMVYGSSILLYYLSGRDAYALPWVTNPNYSLDKLKEDLNEQKGLPIIVYCRTNSYYGFEGGNYDQLIHNTKTAQDKGKKEWLLEYLKDNKYVECYTNDYYVVFAPKSWGIKGSKDYQSVFQN